jgi:ABC-type polysaccharide/polyol phosphate export permease
MKMGSPKKVSHVTQSRAGGLRIQLKVLRALFFREMISHFGRGNIGFLWMFVEPMMFSIGIAILWSITGVGGKTMPAAGFALTGYSAIVAWRSCVSRTSLAIKANMGLLYHRNVTVLDLGIARATFEFISVTISFFFLTILFTFLDLINLPVDIFKTICAWMLLGWFFISAGLVALYLDQKSEMFGRVWHVIMYLTLPLTGAFSMVTWLPPEVQKVLLMSPMVNGVEMLREGFFGANINAKYSIGYLISFNFILSFLGLTLTSKIKRLIIFE